MPCVVQQLGLSSGLSLVCSKQQSVSRLSDAVSGREMAMAEAEEEALEAEAEVEALVAGCGDDWRTRRRGEALGENGWGSDA